MIVNIRGKVSEWVEHGVVSEETAQRILSFEQSKESKAWIGFGIAGVGITALITGVISIVAANWESLSDATKLTGYFVAQSLLGVCMWWGLTKRLFWREAFISLFALFFWAGIGVVGQVYNLDGPAWRSLTLWSVLALPAALIANSRLLPSMWCATVLADALCLALEDASSTHDIMRGVSISASIPLLMTALFFWSKGRSVLPEAFRGALLWFGLIGMLAVATPIADGLWGSTEAHFFQEVGLGRYLLIPWVAALLAAGAADTARQSPRHLRLANGALILVVTAYITVPLMVPRLLLLPEAYRMVFAALGFIVIWSIAAASAAMADRRRLYDAATFVIACRFIVAYFQVFGSLTTTGVGLLISGVVILAIGGVWDRARRHFAHHARGKI